MECLRCVVSESFGRMCEHMSRSYQISSRHAGVGQPWIYSSRLHLILYALLLIATPFIFLQAYLIEGISNLTNSTVHAFGLPVKIIPVAALLGAVFLAITFRAYITGRLILAIGLVIILDGLAQQIADYYFGHHFYDLQQNWHYLAYMIFVYMVYRDLAPRGLPIHKLILITYLAAVSLSAIDEAFQMHMSSRVFDIGDIAKDSWGAMAGIVLVYLGGPSSVQLLKNKSLQHGKLKGYYRNPFSLLILIFIFSVIFLFISSILTEFEYLSAAILFTLGGFACIFILIHLSRFKIGKYSIIALFSLALITQGIFFIKYNSYNIVSTRYGLTIYKGIPLPFFDFMVYPDGTFRPVDKKHYFNARDREFLLRKKPDIILIASGMYGLGGKGFVDKEHSFVYNPFTKKGTQIIILKNDEAGRLFNKLKKEKKNVLFIIHNTC